ncbi:MAG: iron-sulfur cluster assembly scaffold protein [Thermoplasmatales archaeon]|nr:iron-sulfur cluster assembly scaffold protein [Thermoplasmatales archaeon]MCW6169803.1 iron-sulfur cluster assembly scaffold protein [Thermoplasmatales archaeon]
MDHYRNPHNYGVVENATSKIIEYNPVCGDTIQITISVEDGKIADAKFIGRGCSISQASASILTDTVKGMALEDAKNIDEDKYIKSLGISLGPSREKCALLAVNALKKCIKDYQKGEKGK